MYKIMVIEDEEQIRQELKVLLGNALYQTVAAEQFENLEQQVAEEAPDLVLLDVTLPGTDGITVCKNIRKTSDVPIIFLTSRNTAMDELNGMTMGGDDYISKPFYAPILLARIAAVVKRAAGEKPERGEGNRITVQGCVLNLLNSTILYDGKSQELTKNEFRICYCLFSNEGRIVPREEIMDDLWENHIFIDDNTLSVHITHIRAKLKKIGLADFIETKRGQGYLVH
ncbi:MAG: response regulator transcription factor [Eubacteriales bacterium]|nr:response regulator transcription factor [Eubacteriales bacterium]